MANHYFGGDQWSISRDRTNAIALIGHSMLDQGLQSVGVSPNRDIQFSLRAAPAWLSILSNGRYRFPKSCKFAVSGTTSEDVNAALLPNGKTQLQSAIDCPATIVMLWTGHNDRLAGWALDRTKTAISTTIQALAAAGKTVILLTPIPTGNTSFVAARFTGTQLCAHIGLRQWMIDKAPMLAKAQVFTADLWPALADYASATTGDNAANVTQDGTHTNARGAYLCAQKTLPVLDALGIPPAPVSVDIPGDIFNADNPTGNLLAADSGRMYATTAAVPAATGGVTWAGGRPSSWAFDANSAAQAATLTVTGSIVTNARGKWFQWVISGTTGAAIGPRIGVYQGLSLANLAAGDVLAASGEFEVDSTSTGLVSVQQDLSKLFNANANYDAVRTFIGDTTGGAGSGALDSILTDLTTPLAGTFPSDLMMTSAAGDNAITLYHYIRLKESATINATIRLRHCAVRKVLP